MNTGSIPDNSMMCHLHYKPSKKEERASTGGRENNEPLQCHRAKYPHNLPLIAQVSLAIWQGLGALRNVHLSQAC